MGVPSLHVADTNDLENPLRLIVAGRTVTIASHAGSCFGGEIPNARSAIVRCVETCVPRLELDLRFLADDVMVAFHDAVLEHATTASGPLASLGWDVVGAARYRGEPIEPVLRFEDAVELLRDSGTELHVDLKVDATLSSARLDAIERLLAPLGDNAFVGSMDVTTLAELAERGLRVALDPFMHFHYWPGRPAGRHPTRLGAHGLYDDSVLAQDGALSPRRYMDMRVDEIVARLPAAFEWMVDRHTLRHFAELDADVGESLRRHDIRLSAWTFYGGKPGEADDALEHICHGADVIIANAPFRLATDLLPLLSTAV